MSGRLAFRRWQEGDTVRNTEKVLVMSSAMVIGEIMIMNMIPCFFLIRVL